jgi:hypothetical protein
MKNKEILRTLVLSVMIFSSCVEDEKVAEIREVEFRSGVSQISTRVGGPNGNIWDGNEHIGVYMVDYSHPDLILNGAENVEYAATDEGTTTSFISTTPICYPPSGFVNFIAYYPYSNRVNNKIYPVDVSNQTDQSAIDLMVAPLSGNGYYGSTTTPVSLQFTHQLVKLKLRFYSNTENLSEISSVKIKGMRPTADFNIFSSTISREGPLSDIAMKRTDGYSFEAIVVPCSLEGKSVEIVVGDYIYVWDMTNNKVNNTPVSTLERGRSYGFDIMINKSQVSVSGTITAWNYVEGTGDITGTGNIATCHVGDYYFADGSWSQSLSTTKTCIGVVYQTDGLHGKVVSLNEGSCTWGPNKLTTHASHLTDGKENMKTVWVIDHEYNSFPAFKFCASLGDGWYLPARDELADLFKACINFGGNDFSAKLVNAHGKGMYGGEYWSSTELSSTNSGTGAWKVVLTPSYWSWYDGVKVQDLYVRAILAF